MKNMKKKNIILIILCAITAVCMLSALIINIFNIKFNLISYHSFEQDGYSFTFKGSFNTVRKLVVKQDSKKLCSLPFDAVPDVFDNEFGFSAKFIDVNGDSASDLILPSAVDEDGDIHYSLYLADSENGFIFSEDLTDLSNISVEEATGFILTNDQTKEILAEATDSSPEFYILRHKIARHTFRDGKLLTLEERAITYYSENDYYCYSVYKHDDAFGGLKYQDEKWFEPEELENYPLNWD